MGGLDPLNDPVVVLGNLGEGLLALADEAAHLVLVVVGHLLLVVLDLALEGGLHLLPHLQQLLLVLQVDLGHLLLELGGAGLHLAQKLDLAVRVLLHLADQALNLQILLLAHGLQVPLSLLALVLELLRRHLLLGLQLLEQVLLLAEGAVELLDLGLPLLEGALLLAEEALEGGLIVADAEDLLLALLPGLSPPLQLGLLGLEQRDEVLVLLPQLLHLPLRLIPQPPLLLGLTPGLPLLLL
mmetsp:Transcript_1215/g.2214  ORF Transcript_1215/g.2214 Transcript_1215/m.2214 type:complete len:241 (+) Transcript_1215:1450-2172(+)